MFEELRSFASVFQAIPPCSKMKAPLTSLEIKKEHLNKQILLRIRQIFRRTEVLSSQDISVHASYKYNAAENLKYAQEDSEFEHRFSGLIHKDPDKMFNYSIDHYLCYISS